MKTSRTERGKTKLRFALLYALSLLLAVVVMSAFWQKMAAKKPAETTPQTAETETYFMQFDTALHTKTESLDASLNAYVKSRQAGTEPDLTALAAARTALRNHLDSIEQQASYLNEGPKKTAMGFAVTKFRKELADKDVLLSGMTALPKTAFDAKPQPVVPATDNGDETERLKRLVQEKDQTIAALQKASQTTAPASGDNATLQKTITDKDKLIASLQTELKQKETALQNASSQSKPAGGEWQQKYQSLKSAFDKVSTSEKSLKTAYQTLADDNRRLLSQLQSARKG